MRKHVIYAVMALCLCLCTACTVPEPETWESLEPIPTTEPSAAETTEELTETVTPTTVLVSEPDNTNTTDETGETDESNIAENTEETEETTEETKHYPWQDAYASVLSAKAKAGGYEEGYFTLLSINNDNIPELVLLLDEYMELYHFDGTRSQLLLEESVKGKAVDDENICYRPGTGMLSIRFDTMGGGRGFVIGVYEELERTGVNWYRFNYDDLDPDSEMPHNKAWDNAETLDVQLTEQNEILLGNSWVCIDEEFDTLTKLTEKNAAQVGDDWQSEIGISEDATEDTTEEQP